MEGAEVAWKPQSAAFRRSAAPTVQGRRWLLGTAKTLQAVVSFVRSNASH
jgi:hypothetical protein